MNELYKWYQSKVLGLNPSTNTGKGLGKVVGFILPVSPLVFDGLNILTHMN